MDDIVALSKARIERGSKSFSRAAALFDVDTRASAYMLYAWCRHCDDEIDGQDHGHARAGAGPAACEHVLAKLTEQTTAAVAGRADDPVFIALSRVVAKHQIPAIHPLELLEGFRMDVDRTPYETVEDTLRYSYHVAGVVGVMMAMIMGVRDRETLNRASDLGIAFQLTNIARDVVPDAREGRCYLPSDWLADVGLTSDPSAVADPNNRQRVFDVTHRLLDRADDYYNSAQTGIPHLPPRAAWAIAAARNVYRDIGNVIRQRGPAAWDTRAYVGKSRQIAGVALGGAQALWLKGSAAIVGSGAGDRSGLWTHPGLGDATPAGPVEGFGRTTAAE
ncbi:MAG: phytoene/squalene synthase family protein [Pseudomonadota bacterium]